MNNIDKKDRLILTVIFIISFLFYTILVNTIRLPTFTWSDEAIWVSLAKSFHFNHNFQCKYIYQSYDCTLYSILISIAYFISETEHILTTMRLIGVLLMSTACIPIYLLAEKMHISKGVSIVVSLLTILMPEMLYTCFLTQEVLFYPLVLWLFYYLYEIYEEKKQIKFLYEKLGVLFFILYWTKIYAIVFLVAFVLLEIGYLFLEQEESKQKIKNIIKVITSFIILFILNKILIYTLNGFHSGQMHYQGQISRISKITIQTVFLAFKGFILYLLGILVSFGMFPFCLVCSDAVTRKKNKFIHYLCLTTLGIIGEVVLSIYLVENIESSTQYRIHIRYFFPLLIPYFLCMLKILRQKNLKKHTLYVLIADLSMASILFLLYFESFFQRWGQSVIDAMTINIFRNLQVIEPDFYRFLLLFYILVAIISCTLLLKYKFRRVSELWLGLMTLGFLLYLPLNYKMVISTYQGIDVKTYESKLISTAKEIGIYDYVIFVQDKRKANNLIDDNWGNFLNLYATKEVRTIEESALEGFEVPRANACIILPVSLGIEIENGNRIENSNKMVEVYQMNRDIVKTKAKTERIFELEGFSFKNAVLQDGKLKMNENGEIWGPYWSLEGGKYEFCITGNCLSSLELETYALERENATYFETLNLYRSDSEIRFCIQLKKKQEDFELHLYDAKGEAEISEIVGRLTAKE